MTTFTNEELLNKGCEIKLNGVSYKCYNETSLMHFIRLGENSQMLSIKNKNNLLNATKKQILSFIDRGICEISVGHIIK